MTDTPSLSLNEQADDPFVCCGCGKPLDLGEYRSCDCPTGAAYRRGLNESVGKKNRCAWCDSVPTRANIDGEDLCQGCCDKWCRSEGQAALEREQEGQP